MKLEYYKDLKLIILSGSVTAPLLFSSPLLILSTNSIPSTTFPKTVYWLSRNGAGLKKIKPGITEREISANIHYEMFINGGDIPSSPMNFLNQILKRPNNEKPFVLLVVGKPKDNCQIPVFAEKKKTFNKIVTIF